MRTVEIFIGSGIERGRACKVRFVGMTCDGVCSVGQECPTHTSRGHTICSFQRRLEIGWQAGGLFGGGEHPLIEGAANAAALLLVFYDDEAQEAAAGGEARAHGIDAGEHAVEGESHVVIFGELDDGEHAALKRCATQRPISG